MTSSSKSAFVDDVEGGRPLDIVLAHDYLNQRGGAERVALELARIFQPRCIVTALHDPDRTLPGIAAFKVDPSAINRIELFRRDARRALPLLAPAWSLRAPVSADAVVCSSSGWAHAIRVCRNVPKVVYCHNPARWLYQKDDYLAGRGWPIRLALNVLRPILLHWDKIAARSADIYIANSTSVARRIKAAYGRDARVVFPPVLIDTTAAQEPVSGVPDSFFLMVGRARGYKGARALIDAFREMPDQTLVIAGSSGIADCPPNVIVAGYVSEAQLRWLYASARALVSVSREDFGLTPIEANGFGTPALLLRAGGFLDSTDEGVSGLFIESDSAADIRRAVQIFPSEWDRDAIKCHADKFSPNVFARAMTAAVREAIARHPARP